MGVAGAGRQACRAEPVPLFPQAGAALSQIHKVPSLPITQAQLASARQLLAQKVGQVAALQQECNLLTALIATAESCARTS
jgi:hypothetical protein